MRRLWGFRQVTALYLAVVLLLIGPLAHWNQALADQRAVKSMAVQGALGAGALAVLYALYRGIGTKAVAAPAATGVVSGTAGWLGTFFGKILSGVGWLVTRPYILGPALLVGGGLLAIQYYNSRVTQGRHDPNVVQDAPIGGPAPGQFPQWNPFPYLNTAQPGPYGLLNGNGASGYTLPGAMSNLPTPNFVDTRTGKFNTLGIPGAGGPGAFSAHSPAYVNGFGTVAVQGPNGIDNAQFNVPGIGDPARTAATDRIGRGLTGQAQTIIDHRRHLQPGAAVKSVDLHQAQADRAQAYDRLMSTMKSRGAGSMEKAIDEYRSAESRYKEITGSH